MIGKSDLNEGIPETVTLKELSAAADEYEKADIKGDLAAKEDTGDRLYRLSRALLRRGAFYSYRDYQLDHMFDENTPELTEDDFEP